MYNPDVRTYEVSDTDGSYLALLYVDFHPRKGKQDGAWMTEYQGQWIERDGTNVRPHVSLVMNLSRPTADKPALLNLSEVETFLHEFGHSLHGMFANTRFESLSGTNVWWDFVEMPSQFMENYAVEKDFLHTFAFHYKTGEPMPDELIDKVVASRNFNAASACLRQVSTGLLDMAYYTLTEPFTANLMEFEKKAWAKAIITKQLPDTCMTTQFSHIMAEATQQATTAISGLRCSMPMSSACSRRTESSTVRRHSRSATISSRVAVPSIRWFSTSVSAVRNQPSTPSSNATALRKVTINNPDGDDSGLYWNR